MYAFESRIRYSEVDYTELLTLPALINYFQDCSTFQSEDIGLGIEVLKERGKVWVLSSWQVEVNRYPKMGERIKVETWATGFDGLYGTRNFQMKDEKGCVVAFANSIWVFMDTKKNRPIRPQTEDVEAYGVETPIAMEYAPRKITLPKETKAGEPFPVLRSQIDTNEHVNNCQYIQMAVEVMPECSRAGAIRVEYKKSAVLGNSIVPRTAVLPDRKVVELCGIDEKPFAIVEFKER